MPIAEVQSRFDEFAAGTIGEDVLRKAVREAVRREPQLAPAYAAMTLARAKGGAISTALAATIAADIAEPGDDADRTVFSPRGRSTEAPVQAPAQPAAPVRAVVPEMPVVSSRDDRPVRLDEPMYPRRESVGMTAGLTTGSTTGTTGSAWDAPERLAEVAAPLNIGSVLGNRFELLQELGRGGMGVVYKALDRATAALKDRNPYVAIKVLNDEFKRHPLAVRSLQREARKAQKLAHPNIVKVYDFDRDGGNVYMVMELLSGSSLDEALKSQGGSYPLEEVIRILRGLGAGLSYAHELGIVHADFKPSNAFLTTDGNVKILDFGVARAARSLNGPEEKTIFDAGALGAVSPPYASLEMLSGGTTPDQRDDIYALGCVLYELLAGQHPFNRIDALKARAAGLKPPPLRKLSREQWRALQGALAFERDARTATVAELVERFCAPGKARHWWLALAASVVLVAAAAAWIVPRQWDSYHAGQLAADLASPDEQIYSQALGKLKVATRQIQTSALASDKAREALVKRYRAGIEQAMAPGSDDFPRAREMWKELKNWLPDLRVVEELGAGIDATARKELQKLAVARDEALQRGALIPQQGKDDLASVLARWQRIDPGSKAPAEPGIAAAYEAAAREAVAARELELARSLVDAGLKFLPNNGPLLAVQASYQSELEAQKNAARIAQLEQRLAALNPNSATFVDQVLQSRDDLLQLSALSPTSSTLSRLQAALQTIVQQQIKAQLARNDVAGAGELLLNMGELLPEQVLAAARAAVLEQGRAQETRQLETLDRLRRAVLSGRLESVAGSAQELFASLQRGGAGPDLVASARDLLGYGYLRRARRARMSGDNAGAVAALATARRAQPGAVWRTRIDSEDSMLKQPAARQVAGATSELDAARRKFAEILRTSVIGDAELAALGDSLDRMEALGANAQELNAGLLSAEERLIPQITRMKEQSGADQAQLLARRVSETLLGSERIAEISRQLRSTTQEETRPLGPDVLSQRKQLAKLLANPAATSAWAESMRGVLQRLGDSLRADDPSLLDARHTAGEVFSRAAADARARGRLDDARNLLALGRSLDPQSASLKEETGTVQVAQDRKQKEDVDTAQQEGIKLLKQKLVDQVNAGSMPAAEATATVLRRVLAGSVYVSSELPKLLIGGYAALAKRQMLAGQVNESLDTLLAARKKFGTAAELKNLEARYIVVGDAYDRLSTAVGSLNVAEQRGYLEELRASEGADYRAMELMLARTLANRIADQRAGANRGPQVAAVLAAGKQIFPEHALLLEQGTAGALPPARLELRQ